LPKADAFPLSGLVYCAHCGGKMFGRQQKNPNKSGPEAYRWHLCTNYSTKGICAKRSISEPDLVRVVTDLLLENVIGPDAIGRMRQQIRELATDDSAQAPAETARLEKRLAMLDQSIAKAARNMMLVDDVSTLGVMQQELAKIRDERNQLAKQVTVGAGRNRRGVVDVEKQVDEALSELRRLAENLRSDDPSLVRATFQAFIERIDLTFEDERFGKRLVQKFQRGVVQFRDDFFIDFSEGCSRTASRPPPQYKSERTGLTRRSSRRSWSATRPRRRETPRRRNYRTCS
jgi:hypothetical protein